jgi:hypothetical protein
VALDDAETSILVLLVLLDITDFVAEFINTAMDFIELLIARTAVIP